MILGQHCPAGRPDSTSSFCSQRWPLTCQQPGAKSLCRGMLGSFGFHQSGFQGNVTKCRCVRRVYQAMGHFRCQAISTPFHLQCGPLACHAFGSTAGSEAATHIPKYVFVSDLRMHHGPHVAVEALNGRNGKAYNMAGHPDWISVPGCYLPPPVFW